MDWKMVLNLAITAGVAKGKIKPEEAAALRQLAMSGTAEAALEMVLNLWIMREMGDDADGDGDAGSGGDGGAGDETADWSPRFDRIDHALDAVGASLDALERAIDAIPTTGGGGGAPPDGGENDDGGEVPGDGGSEAPGELPPAEGWTIAKDGPLPPHSVTPVDADSVGDWEVVAQVRVGTLRKDAFPTGHPARNKLAYWRTPKGTLWPFDSEIQNVHGNVTLTSDTNERRVIGNVPLEGREWAFRWTKTGSRLSLHLVSGEGAGQLRYSVEVGAQPRRFDLAPSTLTFGPGAKDVKLYRSHPGDPIQVLWVRARLSPP